MALVVSLLYQKAVDTSSPEWRAECEASWLLTNKPTRAAKHRYLYGVNDRARLMAADKDFGHEVLADNWKELVDEKMSVLSQRGIAAADKLLADAKLLYERRKAQPPEGDDDGNRRDGDDGERAGEGS